MLANPNSNNGPESDPIRDNGNNIPTWDGLGPYNPLPNIENSGGGGGGGYVAPVTPNPTFVPPSYAVPSPIKINLSSDYACNFLENNLSIGIGTSTNKNYTTISFGTEKVYKAEITNKISLNYYTVSVEKKYNMEPDTNLVFGDSSAKPTGNDLLFSEVLSIKEYTLDSNGAYIVSNERKLALTNAIASLEFQFTNITPTPSDTKLDYEMFFTSDFGNELGDKLALKYNIISQQGNLTIDSDTIKLSEGSNDLKHIDKSVLANAVINFSIEGVLPAGYDLKRVYYTTSPLSVDTAFSDTDLSKWKLVDKVFSIPGKDLLSRVKIHAKVVKVSTAIKPTITLTATKYDFEVKDSDGDKQINIPFTTTNSDYVDVYFGDGNTIRVAAAAGYANLFFKRDFKGVFGTAKIKLVSVSNQYGTSGRGVTAILNLIQVDNFPSITQITFPDVIDIPSFSDMNIEYDVSYKSVHVSSIDVELLAKDGVTKIPLFKNITPNGSFKINLKDLASRFTTWNGSNNVTLSFKPYSRNGATELIGNDYQVVTGILYPSIQLDEDIIRKTIYDAFIDKLKFQEPEKESKHLTHLANFENDEHILISSWEEDNWTLSDKGEDELGNQIVTKEVKSVILKLYSPLPANVVQNSTFWITKLMTNPLVETVVLNDQATTDYPYIAGPNFSIDVDFVKGNSIGCESLDDLIISASSSTNLIQTYLSKSLVDTGDLNVQYVTKNTIVPSAPNSVVANFNYGKPANGNYYGTYPPPIYLSDYHNYRVYSYVDTESGKVFSNDYAELPVDLHANGSNLFVINVSWDAVENVDGYLVLKYNPDNWYYDGEYYTNKNSFIDTNLRMFTLTASPAVNQFNGNYLWKNFVHFSSAEERVNNFVYKVQLIENYEQLILSASTDYTGNGNANWTGSLASQQELQRQQSKKSSIIQGFDGFESFLYTPKSDYTNPYSTSATWPHNGNVRLASTDPEVVNWYDNIIAFATLYDNQNQNYLVNNIPQYILTSPENENFLLFFSMIGHHFDTIYFYTKALENSRGHGYRDKGGLADKLLYDTIKSFGWDAKNLGSSDKLWEYVFGEDSNGNTTESNPRKERTNEVWRRVINNLPYLLKHKGTRRGIHALMACYGIPSSNLSIMEFGGPEVTTDSKSKLLVDDTSYALKFHGVNDNLSVIWQNTQYSRKPDTIEVFLKANKEGDSTAAGFNGIFAAAVSYGLQVYTSGSTNSEYGKVYLTGGSADIRLETPLLPIYNGRFFGVCLTRKYIDASNNEISLFVKQIDGEREIFSSFISGTFTTSQINWDAPVPLGYLQIGSSRSYVLSGSIDEARLWATPLSRSVFEEHCAYPEMINGNHISSSTEDLLFRLGFEYPKNLNTYTKLINVAPIIYYSGSLKRNNYEMAATTPTFYSTNAYAPKTATASTFTSITTYPYNFEKIDRNCVLEIPDLGSSRYSTNKIRFEEQTLVSDLSAKHRSTKKAIDTIPTDSNRVGLFVSPNKELNFDIAKSLGSNNLDDYIGDPSDRYSNSYKGLDSLRSYYFQRVHNRDIYQYINLIKSYEKAMFDDIKQMLPARVVATTGLLIEPHFLERSKYTYTKPTGSNFYSEGITTYESSIIATNEEYNALVNADLGEKVSADNEQYESIINADFADNLFGENEQYTSIISANDTFNVSSEYEMHETSINAKMDLATVTSQASVEDTNLLTANSVYQDVGFSIYGQNGYAIYNYYNTNGVLTKERITINLVTEKKEKFFEKYIHSYNGVGDPRGGFIQTSSFYNETNLVVQSYSGSTPPTIPTVAGNIVSVVPVNGYLATHYKNVSDLTTGMENSYFRGCKNTSATTLDGSPPVEIFISNPNTIKVLPGNRTQGEPILETDT